MLNPNRLFAKSEGIDLPIMYVYLAGRIAGECIDKCLEWRNKIVEHYKNYKPIYETIHIRGKDCRLKSLKSEIVGYESYPISFLDALNSKEADSIDAKGLTSAISPNLIYDKDILSVKKADVVVANMNDYMEEGIEDILHLDEYPRYWAEGDESGINNYDYKSAYIKLKNKILERRPNWGTDYEVSIAMYMGKPVILIAGNERQKAMLENHPFMKRASIIVGSVEELLEKKWLNILYKSISSSLY